MKESHVVTRCQVTIGIVEQYWKRNMVKTQRLIFRNMNTLKVKSKKVTYIL